MGGGCGVIKSLTKKQINVFCPFCWLGPVPWSWASIFRSIWSNPQLREWSGGRFKKTFEFFQHPNMTNILIIIIFLGLQAQRVFPSARGCVLRFHHAQHHLPGWPGCQVMIISNFLFVPPSAGQRPAFWLWSAFGRPSAGLRLAFGRPLAGFRPDFSRPLAGHRPAFGWPKSGLGGKLFVLRTMAATFYIPPIINIFRTLPYGLGG